MLRFEEHVTVPLGTHFAACMHACKCLLFIAWKQSHMVRPSAWDKQHAARGRAYSFGLDSLKKY